MQSKEPVMPCKPEASRERGLQIASCHCGRFGSYRSSNLCSGSQRSALRSLVRCSEPDMRILPLVLTS